MKINNIFTYNNTNNSIAFQQASVMKYANTCNRNLIESAVIKVFSDVLLNIRPGLFSLDNYTAQKMVSFNRIFSFFPVTLVLAVIFE